MLRTLGTVPHLLSFASILVAARHEPGAIRRGVTCHVPVALASGGGAAAVIARLRHAAKSCDGGRPV